MEEILKRFINLMLLGLAALFFYSCTTEPGAEGGTGTEMESKGVSYSVLKQTALDKGLILGTAVEPHLLNMPQYEKAVLENFTSITAENAMKMQPIHPERDMYSFANADKLVDFAMANDLQVRGHTLVWHSQAPAWINNGDWTKEELLEVIKDHIFTVAGRYKGKIYAWDVVNEAFDGGNYRSSVFYDTIGEEFFEKAFIWAHEADPDALLYYNDYSMEGINLKSDRVYKEVKKLLEKGVPIHGIGLQTHLTLGRSYNFESMYQNVKRFTDLGLKVDLTEVDIKIAEPVLDVDLEEQAVWYGKLMELLISTGNNVFIAWGVDDGHSWIPGFTPGFNDPLLLDREYQPKPAVDSLIQAMIAGPVELPYREWEPANTDGRFQSHPFIARKASADPSIDGVINEEEWKGAEIYPFLFNQLNTQDFRLDSEDIQGDWRILYKGNKLFGAIQRKDDITVTGHESSWENDTIEIFIDMSDQFTQMRSIVGQDWEDTLLSGKAQWNDAGTQMEFVVELPDSNPEGLTIGWNIALADNDDGPDATRESQAYPVVGDNNGWQGQGLGELRLEGITPRPSDEPHLIPPFEAQAAASEIVVDGTLDEEAWDDAVIYPLGFNQLSTDDQRSFNKSDLYGYWAILHKGNQLFGYVYREDDVTRIDNESAWLNDNVEIFFMHQDEFVQLRSLVGEDWMEHSFKGNQKAQWNDDGSIMEFSLTLPGEVSAGQIIGWNIGLSDNDDGDNREQQIYPLTGINDSYEGKNLGELILR